MLRFVLLTVVFTLSFGNGFCQTKKEYYSDYLIPEGYVGYVRVVHEVEGAPPLPVENGRTVFKFDETGILKTSDKVQVGWVYPKYYYYTDKERKLLPDELRGQGGMIHNKKVANGKNLDFFVGTERQYSLWYQSNCGKKEDKDGYIPVNVKSCIEEFEKSQETQPNS